MRTLKVSFAFLVTFWVPQLAMAEMPVMGQSFVSDSGNQGQVELALEVIQMRASEVGEFIDRIMGPEFKLKQLNRSQDRILCLKLGVLFGEVFGLIHLSQYLESEEMQKATINLLASSLTLNTYCGVKVSELIPQPIINAVFGDMKVKSLPAGNIKALDREFTAFQDLLDSIWPND